ncbi:structural protein P5, partial [Arthrobacter pityocampae]
MTTPRGVRNRNPGNIDYNPRNAWQGQLGLEEGVARPRCARFGHPENASPAWGRLLLDY